MNRERALLRQMLVAFGFEGQGLTQIKTQTWINADRNKNADKRYE